MTSNTRTPAGAEAITTARLPLFYRRPRPLSSVDHASWRLKPGDYGFASETAFVPIVLAEIAAASRNYPIVFAGDGAAPLALTGLDNNNLFVSEGVWARDAYVPAYVRRYPFGFLTSGDGESFILALDVEAGTVVPAGDEGQPLFEDGKPGGLTSQALAFCDAFQGEASATTEFATALKASDLLIDRRADVTLPDGRRLGVEGFQIVDAKKFAALPDDQVLTWHRKGWLALIHFHLASLDRFSVLLERQSQRAQAPSPVEEAEPTSVEPARTRSGKA